MGGKAGEKYYGDNGNRKIKFSHANVGKGNQKWHGKGKGKH
jgi:hypothetical protein